MSLTNFRNDQGNLETDFSTASNRYLYVVDNLESHFIVDTELRRKWRIVGSGPQKYAAILYGENGTDPAYGDVFLSDWDERGTAVYDLFGGPGEMERTVLGERPDPLRGEIFELPPEWSHLIEATAAGQTHWYLGEEEDMSRVLASLQADTRYAIRVRAYNNLGVYSDWSEALDFKTPSDQSVPLPPTGLEIDFNTPDMIIRWVAPEFNTDNTPLRDLSRYYVALTVSGVTREYETRDTFFIYNHVQNIRDYGTPAAEIDLEIRAVDVHDKMSAPLEGTAVNEPPLKPLDISGFGGFQSITIYMTPHPEDQDIQFYILERAVDDENPPEWEEIITSRNDTYNDILGESDATYIYRYRVRDVFGQTSPYSDPSPGFVATSSLSLVQLSDVSDPSGSAGDVLTRMPNGTYRIQPLDIESPDVPEVLSDLDDVNTSGADSGDALVYDGNIWVPTEIEGGGGGGGESVIAKWGRAGATESTSSSSYTTLSGGPSVTVEVPAGGWIQVAMTCEHWNTSERARMSVRLTGANTVDASDEWCILFRHNNHDSRSSTVVFEDLDGGTTTIEAMYSTEGSSNFLNRRIAVLVGAA